jgi:hypothetical protein
MKEKIKLKKRCKPLKMPMRIMMERALSLNTLKKELEECILQWSFSSRLLVEESSMTKRDTTGSILLISQHTLKPNKGSLWTMNMLQQSKDHRPLENIGF